MAEVKSHWEDPAEIDRLDELRGDADAVAAMWPGAWVLEVGEGGTFPVVESADSLTPLVVPATGTYDAQRHWLLGNDGDRVVFASPGETETPGATIRDVGARLRAADIALATMAVAMTGWHRMEPHCPRCGGASLVVAGGSARFCPHCRRELFPRTDPAVIVAVVDVDDRLLLGHQGVWPAGRFSVLAGFVEVGESLEQAVHREVYEEAGIRLSHVTYVASQPWPFPRSIMLGFRATATTTDIVVDGREIVEARWFTRAELRSAVADRSVGLPGQASIAHRLVSGWLEADPSSESRSEP